VTKRTEANLPTPIEIATRNVLESIRHNAQHFYRENEVRRHHETTEIEFLRILALYFHDKSIADWCNDLDIPDATDPADHAQRR
jgi:hypothetical protein